MSNIVNELHSTVMDNRDSLAVDAEQELTFSGLWSLTDRFAGGLRAHDINKGESVGICLTDPTDLLVAVYGTLRNGCVPVVFPPDLFDSEVAEGLDEVNAPALILDERSPVSMISLSSSMRFIVTVDMDSYFGMTHEEFLDNSGINSSGSRTGLELIERTQDDTALIAYGKRDGEVANRRYSHGDVREAADVGSDLVAGDVDRHLGCLQPFRPMGLMYEASATILDGGCYAPLSDWNPEQVATNFLDSGQDRAYVTPQQCVDLREEGVDPTQQSLAVLHPVFSPIRSEDGAETLLDGMPEVHPSPPTERTT